MIRKILLVEDDRGSAMLMKRNFERVGYYVFTAGNGLEALDIIAKQKVDIVVTDVVMPHMDGVDLYDVLQKRSDTQHLPIIIITDKQLFKEAFAALGVEHFVPKGGDFNLLLEKIKLVNEQAQKVINKKVLISGGNDLVLEQMRRILVSQRCLVSTADNSLSTLQQAFLMVPDIILLDVRMKDNSNAKELIEAVRCFQLFYRVKILTYTYLSGQELEYGALHWQIIEQEARACQEIGGAEFIGNFSQVTFLENIKQYIKAVDVPLHGLSVSSSVS